MLQITHICKSCCCCCLRILDILFGNVIIKSSGRYLSINILDTASASTTYLFFWRWNWILVKSGKISWVKVHRFQLVHLAAWDRLKNVIHCIGIWLPISLSWIGSCWAFFMDAVIWEQEESPFCLSMSEREKCTLHSKLMSIVLSGGRVVHQAFSFPHPPPVTSSSDPFTDISQASFRYFSASPIERGFHHTEFLGLEARKR